MLAHVGDGQEVFQDEFRTAKFVLIKPPGRNQQSREVWEASCLAVTKIIKGHVAQLVWVIPQEVYFSRHKSHFSSHGPLVMVLGSDITQRKQADRDLLSLQAQLRDLTNHDPLTGLYNRRYLEEALD